MSKANFSGDVWGGFAAMLVALPSAIAFGVTIFSPLGAEYGAKGALAGMLGVMALGLIAALIGGTERLISAPCAPAAAVLSALTIQLVQQGQALNTVLLTLFLVAIVSSLIQVLFGVMQVGRLIRYMPFTVVSGYLSGVGLIIILSQLPKWLSLPKGMKIWEGALHPELWQIPGLIIGITTAVVMILGPKISKKVPAVILGLLAGVLAYWALALTAWPELKSLQGNSLVIGPIVANIDGLVENLLHPWQSLHQLQIPSWSAVIILALTLSVLLSIDTLKTCVVLDALTGSRHNSNRELLGQGFGNLIATLLGGAPGAGTMGATLVNRASGGTTHYSGVFQGLWSLLAIVLLTPLIAWIPIASLAALLVVIGFKMMDWKSIELAFWKGTVLDFLVILAVVIVANTVSLIAASGLGVMLAILMFIREQIHTTTIRKKAYGNKVFSKRFRNPEEWAVLEQAGERNVIYELQGSLFFGTTDQLYSALEPELSKARYVLLDFNKVQSLDVTACHMIERILHILQEHQATLLISRLPEHLPSGRDLHSYLDHIGILSKPNTKVFGDMLDALEWMENQTIEAAGLQGNAQNALALAQFDIFQGFSVDQLARLEQCATMRTFVAGEQIFKAGEFGHELMLIARGQVKVSLALEASKTLHLATMGRGQFFGEMSFMDGSIYSADVYAVDKVQVWSIAREQFKPLDAKDQVMQALITKAIALALAQRLRYTNAELLELKNQS